MKKLTRILLLLNLATLAYLIGGARMELPPLEDAFKRATESVSRFKTMSPEQEAMVSVLKAQVETTKTWSKIVIHEYRRSEGSLLGLTLLNTVGLFLLNFTRRAEPSGAENDRPAAPPDRH